MLLQRLQTLAHSRSFTSLREARKRRRSPARRRSPSRWRSSLQLEPLEDRRLLAAGDLDPSFDGNGVLVTDLVASNDAIYDVTMAPDGKIVAVGNAHVQSNFGLNSDFAVVRYNDDGSLDTGFSDDGMEFTPFGKGRYDAAWAVAVEPGGDILVAGQHNKSKWGIDWAFAIARYRPDGSLDTSFGQNGKVIDNLTSGHDIVRDIILQPDGKFVVAGGYDGRGVAMVRYTADGDIDTSFGAGGTGIVVTPLHHISVPEPSPLTVDAAGNLLIAGGAGPELGPYDFAVARYDSNGFLDNTFGASGVAQVEVAAGADDHAMSVAVQSDGHIVLAGTADGTVALTRFDAAGNHDSDFGGGGSVVLTGAQAWTTDVEIDANDNILVGGNALPGGPLNPDKLYNDFAIARYTPDGQADLSFDSDSIDDGVVAVEVLALEQPEHGPEHGQGFKALAIQPDGKIIAGGGTNLASNHMFALARLTGDPPPPPAPTLSIDDVSITEGDSGTVQAVFTVTRSGDLSAVVDVDFATHDGSATVADNDYNSDSGVLTFLANETQHTIAVEINGDTDDEGDENFYVNLSNATGGAVIADSQGVGTILNDDSTTPAVYVSDIAFGHRTRGNKDDLRVFVTILQDDGANTPDAGAVVTIELRDSSGTLVGTDTGTTNSNGVFTSTWFRNLNDGESYTAEVISVSFGAAVWSTELGWPEDEDDDDLPDAQFLIP